MQHLKDNWFIFLVLILGVMVFSTHKYAPNLAHVGFSILAVGILGFAALQALLIAIQTYVIKTNPLQMFPLLRKLPPLQTMQAILFQVLWAGFILLSLAFLAAFIYLPMVHIQFSKLVLCVLAWGLFATLLYGYHRSGWSSDMVAIRTMFGVLLLVIAYFGSKWIEQI